MLGRGRYNHKHNIDQKKPDQEHTIAFHFYKVQNQTKLIHGDESQDDDDLW